MWVALAEAEAELGLPITRRQLDELRRHVARSTSSVPTNTSATAPRRDGPRPCLRRRLSRGASDHSPGRDQRFVTDNTDLILIREGLELVRRRLVAVIDSLASFAERHRDLACLGFTHLQPAQPTTVGKRACLWIDDLVQDLQEIEHRLAALKARGAKGTTGTQASFLELFGGDHEKVRRLDQLVAEKIGFAASYAVTGQTYSRKVDTQVLDVLSGIAQSTHKAATDLRLLQSRKEVEEPFETEQIGSSAMAYKRNPMRAERICSLARFVISLQSSAASTAATQWLERTLDDSANRRLVIPQAFLAIDAVLLLYRNVAAGLTVYPRVIASHLDLELPFMATEAILMAAVARGRDRQDVHERIRQHSQAAAAVVKEQGGRNDLLERLAADPAFAGIDLGAMLEASRFVGRGRNRLMSICAKSWRRSVSDFPRREARRPTCTSNCRGNQSERLRSDPTSARAVWRRGIRRRCQ